MPLAFTALRIVLIGAAAVTLSGCLVGTVAGTAAGVAGKAVGETVHVGHVAVDAAAGSGGDPGR